MKLVSLLEAARYFVKPVTRQNTEELLNFCEFYNESGQLSWTLTPKRLLAKIGSRGRLFGLYIGDRLVGTIGLKESDISANAFEIGYIMIDEDHRTLPNLLLLYKAMVRKLRTSELVYATTNKENTTINRLLDYSSKFEKVAQIRSNFSTNQLFVWLSTEAGDFDTNKNSLLKDYGKYLIRMF